MAWEAQNERRRTRGRPRTKWQDNIQNALLEKGVGWRQARSQAQDRNGIFFAKSLHLMVEEARLNEAKHSENYAKPLIHSVGKMQSYIVLRQLVDIITTEH
jgi:hypothetical protein